MAKYVEVDMNVSIVVDVEGLPIDLRKMLSRGKYDTIYDHEIQQALKELYSNNPLLAFKHMYQAIDEGEYVKADTERSYVYVWGKSAEEVEGESK